MGIRKFTTDLQVKSIVAGKSGQVHLFGKPFPGHSGSLGLRVSAKGMPTWLIIYRINGKQRKYSFGKYQAMTFASAKKQAAALLKGVSHGIDPNDTAKAYKEAETLSDLWIQYLKSPSFKKKTPSTQKEDQRKYDTLLEKPLGSMKLVDIRKKHLSAVLSELAEKSPVSANRLHSLLSVLFKLALNKDLIEAHPMFSMSKPSREKPRNRYLKEAEIKLLWPEFDKCRPNVRDIFKLILLTAQRPGEVMGMRWSEIDLEKELWTIPAEKTKGKGHDHLVPLSSQVMNILRARRAGKGLTQRTLWMKESEYVFPTKHNGKYGHTCSVHKARYTLIKNLDMDSWGAHDLRRTGRTMLSELGIAPNIGERILNHSMGRIEVIYDIFGYLPQKAAALNKLGNRIDQINGVKTDKNNVISIRRAV